MRAPQRSSSIRLDRRLLLLSGALFVLLSTALMALAWHHIAPLFSSRTGAHEGLITLLGSGLLLALAGGVILVHASRHIAAPVYDLASTFEEILRHAPLLISIQDREGRVVRGSKNLIKTFDLDPDARQHWVHEFRAPERTAARAVEDSAIFDGLLSVFNEIRTLTVRGETKSYSVSRFPLFASGSEHIEFICSIALDISEQLELEARIEQTRRMETIGQFAGGVAHDFNNLLMAILGTAELLAEAAGDDENLRTLAQEITRSGRTGTDLTSQLLSFGRRQDLTKSDLDLVQVVNDFHGLLRRLLPADIVLDLRLGSAPLWVHADRGQLEQVLMNLIANARDAMPSGGTITVTAQRVEPDGPIELTVSDTGQGIPPELFDRILDPFITTKEAGKGTGLGLSIVHGIVEQHDGVLRFESTVGEGTAFTVRLPRIEAPLDLIQPPPRQPSTHALRVLVVEDNPDIRALERRRRARAPDSKRRRHRPRVARCHSLRNERGRALPSPARFGKHDPRAVHNRPRRRHPCGPGRGRRAAPHPPETLRARHPEAGRRGRARLSAPPLYWTSSSGTAFVTPVTFSPASKVSVAWFTSSPISAKPRPGGATTEVVPVP
jgi:signal transduction histidine kinase